MFVGRKQEMERINRYYYSDRFECIIVYGRRRIGKTSFINEFQKDKKGYYFQAINTSKEENLNHFSKVFYDTKSEGRGAGTFNSYDAFFEAIKEEAMNEKIVVTIDEYPYLAEGYPAISSILQRFIDHEFKDNVDMTLILCGSSLSFMENQVLGYKSPLFGRRTAQFKMEPLSIWETKELFPHADTETLFGLHSITGGIPQYLQLMDESLSLKENIMEQFLNRDGYLFQEAQSLLLQEFREPDRYELIIQAIAEGSTKRNEISQKSEIPYNTLSPYLSNLMDIGIIEKEKPLFDKKGRKSIYKLKDGFFRFWYKFIFNNLSFINGNRAERAWTRYIEPQLSDWLSLSFEELCKAWCIEYEDKLPFLYDDIGRWWGNNSKERRQDEIDILAYDQSNLLIGECKYRNSVSSSSILTDLKRKASLFDDYCQVHFILFSKIPVMSDDELPVITLEDIVNTK